MRKDSFSLFYSFPLLYLTFELLSEKEIEKIEKGKKVKAKDLIFFLLYFVPICSQFFSLLFPLSISLFFFLIFDGKCFKLQKVCIHFKESALWTKNFPKDKGFVFWKCTWTWMQNKLWFSSFHEYSEPMCVNRVREPCCCSSDWTFLRSDMQHFREIWASDSAMILGGKKSIYIYRCHCVFSKWECIYISNCL